jgi:hypothetical protein
VKRGVIGRRATTARLKEFEQVALSSSFVCSFYLTVTPWRVEGTASEKDCY